MASRLAKKYEVGDLTLGKTDAAIRLIYWITIPKNNKDQIVVRFLQKRGDGKLLKLVNDRNEMSDDSFRSQTDRYLAEWLYDECAVEALDHCVVVPRHKIPTFLSLLSKGRSFYYGKEREKLRILPTPAKPILKVTKEPSGSVKLIVKYKVFDKLTDLNKNDLIVENPLWVRNGDMIFEIESHEIFRKWPMLKKGAFSLSANQAHDFLFNQVPRLKQEIQVEVDSNIKVKESQKNIKPHIVIDIDLEAKRIVLTPKVSYNNQEVPLLKEIKDAFLFFSKESKSSTGEYIKRDVDLEAKSKSLITSASPVLKEKRPYSLQMVFNKSPEFCFNVLIEIMDNMPTQWQWKGLEKLTEKSIITKDWSLFFEVKLDEDERIVVFPSFKANGHLLSMYDIFKTKNRLRKIVNIDDGKSMAVLSAEICDFFEYYIERSAIDRSRDFMVLHAGDAADLERRIAALSDIHFTRSQWDEGASNLCKALQNFMGIEQVELQADFQGELRNYQHDGVNWLNFLKRFGFGGILADDMGLGKTIQTIAFLNQERKTSKHPSLVVCPTSVVENWMRECNRFAPDLKVIALVGKNRSANFKDVDDNDFIITSYPLIQRDLEEYAKRQWFYLIMDEAQKVKNHRTKTHEAFCQIKAKYKLALSGTPIENRLMELWSIFQIVMPGFLMSQTGFKRYWAQPIEKGNNHDRRNELKTKLMPFILRRTKDQVLQELPPKTETLHYCELTEKQKNLYREIAEYSKSEIFKTIDSKGMEKSYFSILTALLRLRQICCHPSLVNKDMNAPFDESGKIQELFPFLEEVIEEGHRILLFSQFVEMLQIIQTGINQFGWESVYLDGSTKNRQAVIDEFQENDDIKIFLLSLKAGGVGINLTGADYVIHFDPWWNPAVENQATDRAHRIGQDKPVFVYRMITRDTIEEKIHNMQQRKKELADSLITDETSWLKRLSLSDIENLFDSPV